MNPLHSIITGCLILLLLIGGYYFFFGGNAYIGDIEEKVSTKNISFNDETILSSSDEKINYYQVQIYPAEFDFICTNNEEVCNKILEKRDKIGVFSLGTVGREIDKKSEAANINFDLIIGKKTDNPFILKDIFSQLYLDDGFISQAEQSGAVVKNIELEHIDSKSKELCIESIKNSLPEGISELDTTYQDSVDLHCGGLDNINDMTLAFGGLEDTNGQDDQLDIQLKISALKIEYTFFSKIDGKFEELSKEEKIIKKQIRLSSIINLADFN